MPAQPDILIYKIITSLISKGTVTPIIGHWRSTEIVKRKNGKRQTEGPSFQYCSALPVRSHAKNCTVYSTPVLQCCTPPWGAPWWSGTAADRPWRWKRLDLGPSSQAEETWGGILRHQFNTRLETSLFLIILTKKIRERRKLKSIHE